MLEQAIIDAKELKEAAQRNAQEAVIERYQKEIKEAVDKILEQEDLGLDAAAGEDLMGGGDMGMDMGAEPEAGASPGAPQVEKVLSQLSFLQTGDDDDYVDLNLSKLEEALNIRTEDMLSKIEDNIISENLLSELGLFEDDLDEEVELEEDLLDGVLEEYELEEDLDEASFTEAEALDEDEFLEEINLEEDYLDEDLDVFEEEIELEEDAKPDFLDKDNDGDTEEPWPKNEAQDPAERANVPQAQEKMWLSRQKKAAKSCEDGGKKYEKNKFNPEDPLSTNYGRCTGTTKLTKESRRIERQNKSLLKEQTKLNNKTQLLEERLNKYGTIINKLNNKLNESNLLNAKLLYQNRVLDSISLNERQKDKIVDAIQNANSVEEAKIIFETLQSTVGTRNNKKVPESLNEVITRSSSAFIPRKEEKRKDNNPFTERMKTLAGLK
jgi:hypothetical protein